MNTLQDVFNKIWERAQIKVRSENYIVAGGCSTGCLYRGADCGLPCFAGVLIPDELYSLEFEGKNWGLVVKHIKDKLPPVLSEVECISMVGKAQYIHDSTFLSTWHRRLAQLAREYNLIVPGTN